VQSEHQINYLQRYMDTGFSLVHGWCSDTLASVITAIDAHQKSRGVHGGIAEIGVHHGKLFIMFNSVCGADEKSYAIDVFDNQELNIDNSGSGSLAIFKNNLQTYDRHQGANVSIISADSVTANLDELIDQPVRLFSIDGGHTAEHTISDLKKAQLRLHPEGVIVLDDILNYHWLGVIEGTITFLRTQPTLVPVAIGLNKLFLVNLSFAEKYRELFRGQAMMTKYPVKFCGYDVVALG
jgi:Methyltransferase domain